MSSLNYLRKQLDTLGTGDEDSITEITFILEEIYRLLEEMNHAIQEYKTETRMDNFYQNG